MPDIAMQYLVFEYIEKTLLEVLESRQRGLSAEEVSVNRHLCDRWLQYVQYLS